MSALVLTAVLWVQGAGAADQGLGGVADVRGYRRGVDAATLDPAATAFVDGFELQARQLVAGSNSEIFGVYGTLPLAALRLTAGYEWLPVDPQKFERSVLGLSLALSSRWALGVSRLGYVVRSSGVPDGGVWNLGLFGEVSSWLSLSLGVDAVNSPVILDARQRFAYRAGTSLRPFVGAPWLTVGGELRIDGRSRDIDNQRLVVDVGLRGVHLIGAYDFDDQGGVLDQTLSVGLSLALGHAELRALGTGSEPTPDESLAVAATLRQSPSEDLLRFGGRTVQVVARGGLDPEPASLFVGAEAVSTLPVGLRRLARDPTVSTVRLAIGSLDVGLARIEELRREIHALRAAGKRVIVEMASVDDKGYMLAAAADHIRLDPASVVGIDGFSSTVTYVAGTLGKLGVRVESVEVGRYKSAPDQLTRRAPRPEDEEVRRELLDHAQQSLTAALMNDRKLSAEQVQQVLAQGALTAKEALAFGLVDELVKLDEREATEDDEGVAEAPEPPPSARWSQPPIIAVVPVVGSIARTSGDNPLPGETAEASKIVEWLDQARADGDVRGVVLRVDSPGGEIFASELIWRAVKRVAAVKPVVVSMGDTAASGGYYVAAAAHAIFAEPDTITGSIGIFLLKLDLSGLYDKLDVNNVVYKTAEHADWESTTRPLTEEERARVRRLLEDQYEDFLQKVADGRGLALDEVREIAEGRVYTGARAQSLGLVDHLGGLADAVDEVRRRAGLELDETVELWVPKRALSLPEALFSRLTLASGHPLELLRLWRERLQRWDGQTLALMPFTIHTEP